MPRYTKSKNKKLVRKHKDFKHPYQVIHFLQTSSDKQFQPFRDQARDYLSGATVPPVKLQKRALQRIAILDPKELTKHAVRDFNGDDALGGGVGKRFVTFFGTVFVTFFATFLVLFFCIFLYFFLVHFLVFG